MPKAKSNPKQKGKLIYLIGAIISFIIALLWWIYNFWKLFFIYLPGWISLGLSGTIYILIYLGRQEDNNFFRISVWLSLISNILLILTILFGYANQEAGAGLMVLLIPLIIYMFLFPLLVFITLIVGSIQNKQYKLLAIIIIYAILSIAAPFIILLLIGKPIYP